MRAPAKKLLCVLLGQDSRLGSDHRNLSKSFIPSGSYRIPIKATAKLEILQRLNDMGLNAATHYPGLDGSECMQNRLSELGQPPGDRGFASYIRSGELFQKMPAKLQTKWKLL
jgi:hypothetical protein